MRHDIASQVGATAGITQDVAQDPTVGLSRSLSDAHLVADDDEGPGMCTMCGQDVLCVECGEQSAPGILLEATDQDTLLSNAQKEVDEQSSKN